MSESKYEIRSEEMTSLLKKIPNAFLTKGNFLVLAMLVVFFFLLNRYGPRDELKLIAQVDSVFINDQSKTPLHFSLIVTNIKDTTIKVHSDFEYRFENGNTKSSYTLSGKIDTVIYRDLNSAVFHVTANSSTPVREKSIGDLIIEKEKKSFFSHILSSILNL